MNRARWAGVGIVGVVLAGLLVVVGFDLPHAALGGLGLVAGVVVVIHLGIGQRVALPRLPYGRRDGTRSEVSSLSWSLYGSDGIGLRGQSHLRRVALAALLDAGIDVDTPDGVERAQALLSPGVVAFLLDPAAPPPDSRAVRATVLTLEKLETLR